MPRCLIKIGSDPGLTKHVSVCCRTARAWRGLPRARGGPDGDQTAQRLPAARDSPLAALVTTVTLRVNMGPATPDEAQPQQDVAAAHSSEEGSEVEWRGPIEAAAGSRPEPVVAETYYCRWKTASGAVELVHRLIRKVQVGGRPWRGLFRGIWSRTRALGHGCVARGSG